MSPLTYRQDGFSASESRIQLKPENDMPTDETAVDALVADWIAAHNNGDAEALAEFYAPDADFVGIDGQVVSGRDAVVAMYAEVFAGRPGNQASVSLDSRRFVSPETCIDDGTWEVTGFLPAGSPTEGRYTTVFRKQAGRWRILCARTMVPVVLPQAGG